jgi:methyl coenzyme M reductase subunit C-like uncharacterized protein (methanogenesis marker protein 7)
MRTYEFYGKVVKKDGSTFPFHKILESTTRTLATKMLESWARSKNGRKVNVSIVRRKYAKAVERAEVKAIPEVPKLEKFDTPQSIQATLDSLRVKLLKRKEQIEEELNNVELASKNLKKIMEDTRELLRS